MIENRKNWIIAPAGNLTMVLVVMLLLFTFSGCGSPPWYKSYGFRSYDEVTRPSSVPVLIEALGDDDEWVRLYAAVALAKIGQETDKAVPVLIAGVGDEVIWRKRRAEWVEALGVIGPSAKEAIPVLVKALGHCRHYSEFDPDYELPLSALSALTKIAPESEEVAGALVNALGACVGFVSEQIPDLLIRIEPQSRHVVPELIKALNNPEFRGRVSAVNTLRRLGPKAKPALPEFVKALADGNPHLRIAAAAALGDMGVEANVAVPALITAMGDQDYGVRKSAVKAIEKIGAAPELVGPALTVALSDPDPGIRKEALLALEKIGYTGHDFLQSLEKIADKDPNNTIRKLASDMLRKMRFTALASGKPVEPKQAPTAAPPVSQTQRPAPPPIGLGQRWAVVIGISQYHDTRIPSLRYASVDAESFYEWLISLNGGKYAPSRVNLLIDRDATARNIRKALFEWLGQALEEDIVTIYFAGHGSPQSPDRPSNLFFLPYDAQYDNIASTGFPMWDIETALKRFIKANKVVVIADACHAGGVGRPFDIATRAGRGIMVNPIDAGLQNLSKVGDGVCVISASDEGQLSQEGKTWGGGHGVFTYFLLQGLKGEADYNNDDTVMLGELIPYLSEKVRRATRNAQSPVVAGKFDPALTIAR